MCTKGIHCWVSINTLDPYPWSIEIIAINTNFDPQSASLLMAIFTLEDKQIIWTNKLYMHMSIWCEFMSYCHWLVRLDRQIIWENHLSRRPNIRQFVCPKICSSRCHIRQTRTICSSENDLSVQTIFSSSSVKTAHGTQSTLDRQSLYLSTIDDESAIISWLSSDSRPKKCWLTVDQVQTEMSIECWSRCHLSVDRGLIKS